MKVNEENVLKEMEQILSILKNAYLKSNSNECDRNLNKAIGKLETLIMILSETKEG